MSANSTTDPARWTLCEARDALARGDVSAVEIVGALLAAIDRRNDDLGCYLSIDRDDVLAQAREADARRARGDAAPLLGVPVGIKDNLNVRGQPCACGSRILESYRAPYDATAIARLRAAGAVLFGRLNMDEFAMGSTTANSAFQKTLNPWGRNRVPGGSSGGSAAAVSADLAIAALGTDTGGSVRQPASFCGCVGLKPTYGRVSRYGLVAYSSSLDQIGPIVKRVRDAAVLLRTLAGRDPMDSTTIDAPVPDYEAGLAGGTDGLRGLRLGLPGEYFVKGIEPGVETAVRAAVDRCRSLGAEIVDVSLPHTKYAVSTYYILSTAEASANLARLDGVRYGLRVPGTDPIEQYGRTRAAGFGAEVKRRIIFGTYVLSSGYYDAYYLQAQKVRTVIRRDFERAFGQCDAILAPVAPTSAYRLAERNGDPLKAYLGDILTVSANLSGVCAISVPCGFAANRMPVGLQILGPAFREDLVLRAAHAYEQASDWTEYRPDPGAGEARP